MSTMLMLYALLALTDYSNKWSVRLQMSLLIGNGFDIVMKGIMCFSKTTRKEQLIMEVPYITSAEDLLQHLMAIFYYLVECPTLGDHHDNFDGHVVIFDGIELMFFPSEV